MTPDEYQSISDLYSLLSRLWLTEVTDDLLRAVHPGPIADTLHITPAMISDPQTIDRLAVEYCALFIGPKEHLPPFQSVWQDGQMQTDTTASVKSFADATQLEQDPNGTIADHLGAELRIMAHVTELLASDSQEELQDLAKEFFQRHLTWTARFLKAASNRAESDFYRAMISLTHDLLESEGQYWTTQ